jgi:hypothetical protein
LLAVIVVAETELYMMPPTRVPMLKPLIGPKLMVPVVTEAPFQVPPAFLILPCRSCQSVVYENAIAMHPF